MNHPLKNKKINIGFTILTRSEIESDFKKKDIYERLKQYHNLTSLRIERNKGKVKKLIDNFKTPER